MDYYYRYKKASLTVDDKRYLYIVRPRDELIKITVYPDNDKRPWFVCMFSYESTWGFDVYRPKTIEILIRFYQNNPTIFSKNIFCVQDCKELFEELFHYFFADSTQNERQHFLKICQKFPCDF